MGYKYSIVDDETDKVFGYCIDVEVLQSNNECCSVLTLHGFKLTKEYKNIPTITLSNFRINFLSKDGNSLGGYYFSPSMNIKIRPFE